MATEENFNLLAKLPVSIKVWTDEFNEDNQNSYLNKNLNENNCLDHAEYITSEEASTILINKMKQLQGLYADHLKTLKHEYILGRNKLIDQINSGEITSVAPTSLLNAKREKSKDTSAHPEKLLSNSILSNDQECSESYIKRRRKLMNAYLRYHRPIGKEGYFALRSKERRQQFSGEKFTSNHARSRSKLSNKLGSAFCGFQRTSFLSLARCQAMVNQDVSSEKSEYSLPLPSSPYTRNNQGGGGGKKGKIGKGSSGKLVESHNSALSSGCGISHTTNVRCSANALPSAKFCKNHILQDTKQQLFRPCGATLIPSADNEGKNMIALGVCQVPVLHTFSLYGNRCALHYSFKDIENKV